MRSTFCASLFGACVCLGALLAPSSAVASGAGSVGILDGIVSVATQARGVIDTLHEVGSGAVDMARNGTIGHAFQKIFTDIDSGTNPINFGGGNIGAYYNFMWPDNDDYPWACTCNELDLQQYKEKNLPYARCRNQEDLSFHDFQANCNPNSSANDQL